MNYKLAGNVKSGYGGCLVMVVAVIIAITAFCFRGEKQYGMKFTQGEIIEILKVVDESSAPHNEVKDVQNMFNRELKQYIDSTGRLKQ